MGIQLASQFDVQAALPLDSRDVVADNTARDAIVSGRRYLGMFVYSISPLKLYQLQTGITNTDWVDVTAGGSTFAGDIVVGGYVKRSIASTITAFATGGQASATAIAKDINRITTCATANDSVKLPAGLAGMSIFIQNDGAASCNVFPATGEVINALAANTALALLPASNVIYYCVATGVWKSFAGGGGGGTITTFGTQGTPRVIATGTGITSGASHMSTTATTQTIIAKGPSAGTNGVTVNPQIQAGTVLGASMEIIGGSTTDIFTLADGTGLSLNGPWTSAKQASLSLTWDGAVWNERSRSER